MGTQCQAQHTADDGLVVPLDSPAACLGSFTEHDKPHTSQDTDTKRFNVSTQNIFIRDTKKNVFFLKRRKKEKKKRRLTDKTRNLSSFYFFIFLAFLIKTFCVETLNCFLSSSQVSTVSLFFFCLAFVTSSNSLFHRLHVKLSAQQMVVMKCLWINQHVLSVTFTEPGQRKSQLEMEQFRLKFSVQQTQVPGW